MTLSLWLDVNYTARPPLLRLVSCDYCIIGGGMTGVSFAYHLAKQGKNVILIEADTIASKSSGRNAGMLISGLEIPYTTAVEKYGKEIADEIWHLTRETIAEMGAISKKNYFNAEFDQSGGSQCAFTQREALSVEEKKDPFSLILTKEQAQEKIVPKAIAGVYSREYASIDPASFIRSLATLAEHEGAHIYENTLAISWIDQGNHYALETSGGVIKAEHIILATNAQTNSLVKTSISPSRMQYLATDVLKPTIKGVHQVVDNSHCFKQTSTGNLILCGGNLLEPKAEATDIDGLNQNIQQHLLQYVVNLPIKGGLKIVNRWAEIQGITPDSVPLLGSVDKTTHIAAGMNAHGLVLSFLFGKEYSKFLLEGKCDLPLKPFCPRRFD